MKNKDKNNLIFTVDLDLLLQSGISINQYFFLKILDNQNVDLYRFYLEQFKSPITKEDLEYLIQKGVLITKDKTNRFTFENLKVTNTFKDIFEEIKSDAIKELEEIYPKKTPFKKRRLQSDKGKWGPKYLSIIKGKPELHEKILNCIKAEEKHRKQTGSEEFWAMLTTYINNARWEDYMEDADPNIVIEEISKDYDI